MIDTGAVPDLPSRLESVCARRLLGDAASLVPLDWLGSSPGSAPADPGVPVSATTGTSSAMNAVLTNRRSCFVSFMGPPGGRFARAWVSRDRHRIDPIHRPENAAFPQDHAPYGCETGRSAPIQPPDAGNRNRLSY